MSTQRAEVNSVGNVPRLYGEGDINKTAVSILSKDPNFTLLDRINTEEVEEEECKSVRDKSMDYAELRATACVTDCVMENIYTLERDDNGQHHRQSSEYSVLVPKETLRQQRVNKAWYIMETEGETIKSVNKRSREKEIICINYT